MTVAEPLETGRVVTKTRSSGHQRRGRRGGKEGGRAVEALREKAEGGNDRAKDRNCSLRRSDEDENEGDEE